MIAAALYLIRRSLVNATRRRVTRLRQPKYLIGSVVGALYLYWLVLRPRRATGFEPIGTSGGEVLAVALLALVVALNWVFGRAETPFSYSLAETQFVFPAPLTRRQVIDFKLLRAQLPLLVSAALTALVFTGGHLGALRVFRVFSLWLLYGTLQLHYAGMALVRASLAQHGVTGLRRALSTLIVLGTGATVAVWTLHRALPDVAVAFQRDPRQGFLALASVLHTGLLGALVWPLRALVAPLLATNALAFASRVPAALLVLVVHYLWVVRSTLAFEEAAVAHAATLARRMAAVREGRSVSWTIRTPGARRAFRLRLAPIGPPGIAILWKNTVGATRELSGRTLVLGAVFVIGASAALVTASMRGLDLVAGMLLVLGSLALLFGPFAVPFDLRRDLEMLDVLKGYPVRGRQVVGGEVAAPVVLIGLLVWGCLLGAFAASASRPGGGLPPVADRVAILLALLPTTAAVLLVLVVAQNAALLVFPAWVSVGRNRAAGLEATGQRILMMAGSLVVLAVALVPGVLVGAIAAAAAHALGVPGLWIVTVGAVAGSGVVACEGVLTVHGLGRVFERLEPGSGGTV